MISWVYFAGAAVLEIAGCFAVWAWLREGRSPYWLVPGVVALLGFAWLLTRAETAHAGRAYAAYGGVYVTASVLWLWLVERQAPDRWDLMGLVACLAGSAIILMPRAA
jgi:small multidrug resistance family-3 protein